LLGANPKVILFSFFHICTKKRTLLLVSAVHVPTPKPPLTDSITASFEIFLLQVVLWVFHIIRKYEKKEKKKTRVETA